MFLEHGTLYINQRIKRGYIMKKVVSLHKSKRQYIDGGVIYLEGGTHWVDIEDMKDNPLNTELYSNVSAEDAKVVEFAEIGNEEVAKGNPANLVPVQVHKDGLIASGHTRKKMGKMIGETRLKAEYTTEPYPTEDSPYDNITNLLKTNTYRELTPSVKLNIFETATDNYEEQYKVEMPPKVRNALLKKLKIKYDTMKKLSFIKKVRPELLKDIDKAATSIEYAYNVASGNDLKVTKKKEGGINLYNLFTPEMKTRIVAYATTALNNYRSMTVKTKDGDYSPIEDELGWESTRFTGIVSDTFMWAVARVLTEEGKQVSSANGHPTDPDVYLENEDERIEIKVTQFKGQGSSTSWKGGKGVREGEFLLIAHDAEFTRLFITFTTLYENDWNKQGNVGTILKLNKWWENKKDTDEFEFWKGEVYDASDITQMQLESINESI